MIANHCGYFNLVFFLKLHGTNLTTYPNLYTGTLIRLPLYTSQWNKFSLPLSSTTGIKSLIDIILATGAKEVPEIKLEIKFLSTED